MLQLQIGFPGGRYFAASPDDPTRPEWPPHPSRVFSALVAAAYAGRRTPSEAERQLLTRLEEAPPPTLTFPPADVRPAMNTYVPVNDVQSRLEDHKKSKGVLQPNRQLRQFPCAYLLGEPEVTLTWPLDLPTEDVTVLNGLAERVAHVGTSHSLVTAQFLASDTAPKGPLCWVPDEHGTDYLRVPRPGRLAELDRLAEQGHGLLRRPVPLCEVLSPYAVAGMGSRDFLASPYDWIVLRLSDASWGVDTAHTLARSVRRAALSLAGDSAPEAMHGHAGGLTHLAWLPLADVGHSHATGRIHGIAIGLPLDLQPPDRALTLVTLAKLEHLTLPGGQVGRLSASLDDPRTPIVLRASTWRRPSTQWSTVTPVLLDRPPRRHSPELLQRAMAQSLVMAGYPEPTRVTVLQHSDFSGAPAALDVPAKVPRFHARVVFDQAVQGPVIAGRWRNFGIGLFRPTPRELLP